MKTRTLTADVEIPYLGFGTFLIADDQVAAAVSEAIRAGYRHIDTAEGYQNESGVGAGIKQALESGGLTRSDLFVTTKLWPGNPAWGQPAKTTAAPRTSRPTKRSLASASSSRFLLAIPAIARWP